MGFPHHRAPQQYCTYLACFISGNDYLIISAALIATPISYMRARTCGAHACACFYARAYVIAEDQKHKRGNEDTFDFCLLFDISVHLHCYIHHTCSVVPCMHGGIVYYLDNSNINHNVVCRSLPGGSSQCKMCRFISISCKTSQ